MDTFNPPDETISFGIMKTQELKIKNLKGIINVLDEMIERSDRSHDPYIALHHSVETLKKTLQKML